MEILKNLFFGFREKPRIFCNSCLKCKCYAAKWEKYRHFGVVYCREPDYEMWVAHCQYIPSEYGGCEFFVPQIGFRSFFLDSFRDPVLPLPGSVVVCDLRLFFLPGVDHSGIVDADGMVIHRDGDHGLERVSPKIFIKRLNGCNGAMSIYVGCNGHSAIGNDEALERAEKALNDPEFGGYDLFRNNCHQFVQYCLTGKRDNDFTFSALESFLCQYCGMDNWRMWDIKLYDD